LPRGGHAARLGRPAEPETFARQGYLLLPGLVAPALTDFLWSYARTRFASRLFRAGDRQAPGTPVAYGDAAFDGLLEHLRPRIEAACGLRLHPTYSYFRLYKRGDTLSRHRDRPACEISVSLNLGQTPAEPWALFVDRAEDGARLGPGDALLYRGHELAHWREAYPGEMLAQVFLHYVDRDGPHAGQRFDGRETLMRPRTDAPPGGQHRPDD
jgi:hypothetical protein